MEAQPQPILPPAQIVPKGAISVMLTKAEAWAIIRVSGLAQAAHMDHLIEGSDKLELEWAGRRLFNILAAEIEDQPA